jgi:hypothetical protein
MTDTNFSLSDETDLDDLPRTLRREHEARARRRDSMTDAVPRADREDEYSVVGDAEAPAATVAAFNVPFAQLVAFYLKSVLAAIPALILLTVILWFMGQALQGFFPELVKMRILITFPNG